MACDLAETTPVEPSTEKVSLFRLVPYWPAETTGRSVTARPSLAHCATGNEQLYARCVCPDTMASTSGETLLTMSAHLPESSIVAQSVAGAPSCTSITTR